LKRENGRFVGLNLWCVSWFLIFLFLLFFFHLIFMSFYVCTQHEIWGKNDLFSCVIFHQIRGGWIIIGWCKLNIMYDMRVVVYWWA
jgi:hypothetical protein